MVGLLLGWARKSNNCPINPTDTTNDLLNLTFKIPFKTVKFLKWIFEALILNPTFRSNSHFLLSKSWIDDF